MKIISYFCLVMLLISCGNDEPTPDAYTLEFPSYYPQSSNNTPTDNPLTTDGINLGKMLFYEKMLSQDSTVSCASCHQQQFGFADNQVFSKGVKEQLGNRNTMALINLVFDKKFFWDGRANSLEEQALGPIENPVEMNLAIEEAIKRLQGSDFYQKEFEKCFGKNSINKENLAKAISQFERTLISANSPYDMYKQGKGSLTEKEKLGEKLFFTHPDPVLGIRGGNCGDCHSGPLTTNRLFSNNGLDTNPKEGLQNVTNNPSDKGKFKIPTLRNIALTSPYMHDGRFLTLEEVLEHYNEHVQDSPTLDILMNASNKIDSKTLELTNEEKEAIIAFLKTLTDKNFIENPKFSTPFNN